MEDSRGPHIVPVDKCRFPAIVPVKSDIIYGGQ